MNTDLDTNKNPIFDGLNAEQIEAVKHKDGPCLVVAGAGSGKTTVMVRRLAYLIEQGVAPDRILLLTFTKEAAKNMTKRAEAYTPYAAQVNSGTFHSIGHRLIRENFDIFKLASTPTIMDAGDADQAFKKILKKKASKETNLPTFGKIASIHSFAVNTKRDVDDVIYDRYPDYISHISFIEECIAEYKSYKRERCFFDYDDLLVLWDKMLDNPSLREQFNARFQYIEIDEHQDSNALQCSIIYKMAGDLKNVMAVGDNAQGIYSFRGAMPATMFDFQKQWPETQLIYLNKNYRSSDEILAVGNSIDKAMVPRFERTLVAGKVHKDAHTPELISTQSSDDEATFIVDQILAEKLNGTPLHEQAVLVRSLFSAMAIEFELTKRKVPYKVVGGVKITEARHTKDMMALIRCAVNTLDELAWVRALKIASGIGEVTGSKVFEAIFKAPLDSGDPTQLILKITKNNPDVALIMKAWKVIRNQSEKPSVTLNEALSIIDPLFKEIYKDEWEKDRKKEVEAMISMSDQYANIEDYISAITLDYSFDKKSDDAVDTEYPLRVSTIHSAKGLEWDCVYIPGFVNGHIPGAYAVDAESMEEEKRIFYVASTRARKKMFISCPQFGFQYKRQEKSRFYSIIRDFVEERKFVNSMSGRGFKLQSNKMELIDPFA